MDVSKAESTLTEIFSLESPFWDRVGGAVLMEENSSGELELRIVVDVALLLLLLLPPSMSKHSAHPES